jgi:hypothetical protein
VQLACQQAALGAAETHHSKKQRNKFCGRYTFTSKIKTNTHQLSKENLANTPQAF